MHERTLETTAGPVVVIVEHGLGRPPAGWRVAPVRYEPLLAGLSGAVGASEDSALDNFWAAAEAVLRCRSTARASLTRDAST